MTIFVKDLSTHYSTEWIARIKGHRDTPLARVFARRYHSSGECLVEVRTDSTIIGNSKEASEYAEALSKASEIARDWERSIKTASKPTGEWESKLVVQGNLFAETEAA